MTPARRREIPSPEAFHREFVEPGLPLLIEGGLTDWPAVRSWTPEGLATRLAGRKVPLASAEDGRFGYDPSAGAGYRVEEMDAAEAIPLAVAAGPPVRYVMQQSIPRALPELLPDVPPPTLAPPEGAEAYLWIGATGCLTPLHFDMAGNLFAQIRGRKLFTLFDPQHDEEVYPFPADVRHANLSHVDPERPDLERFPAFSRARPLTCEVSPGDLLYLPPFFWHHVRTLEASISVSFWWKPSLAEFRTPSGRRTLRHSYRRDRLLAARGLVAGAAGLGLAQLAGALADLGERQLAVLFAGAAVEEAARACHQRRVPGVSGLALRDLGVMAGNLGKAGALGDHEVAALLGLAGQTCRALDTDWDPSVAETQAFLGEACAWAARLAEARGATPRLAR